MAPEIEAWPLLTFGGIGVALTFFGLYLTKLARTRKQKWAGWSIHGASFVLYILIAAVIATSWLRATRRRFLLTDGYKGDFYIIHKPSLRGQKHRTEWRTTYWVPTDGVLVVNSPMPHSTNDEYAYTRIDGTVRRISDIEYGTVPDTPQNRADLAPIVFFPRTGSFTSQTGCTIQFEEVYVGTKANLLKNDKETNLDSYAAAHPFLCSTK
jgi:hypothetical protein